VEDALALERKQREYVEALDRQSELARETLDRSRERYANGLIDYLPVLTALTASQRIEREVLSARRQLLSYRVQLYRALGGEWMPDEKPETKHPTNG
jgi:outer membrane protein TolC